MAYTLSHDDVKATLEFANDSRRCDLHPIWIRERTTEPGTVDEGNRQRLYDPSNLPDDLRVISLAHDGDRVRIVWSDGHEQQVDLHAVAIELGWEPDPEAPPAPMPWDHEPDPLPTTAFPQSGDSAAMLHALELFWTWGFVILGGTPTEPGSLEGLASRFGTIRNTNFGLLFDVFSKPNPVDLAYTPIELTAHTDNPYRMPVPQVQFLHCLVNDAEGGASTLVDGLATHLRLAELDPAGHTALLTVPVTFRYQYEDEILVDRSPLIETDHWGNFVGIRNSDRLDFVAPVEIDTLSEFYRARKTLRKLVNDENRKALFVLAPGDLLMMDNRRLLHGRTAYSLERGTRHLQGCYIDHDEPDGAWRVLSRSR